MRKKKEKGKLQKMRKTQTTIRNKTKETIFNGSKAIETAKLDTG